MMTGTCFEYSDSNSTASMTPTLGVLVKPPLTLDGTTPAMQLEYRIGGQAKMIDSFVFTDGDLYLVRREWPVGGDSVTYKNADSKIAGVRWMTPGSEAGNTLMSSPKADLVDRSGTHTPQDVAYSVTFASPNAVELKTPMMNFDAGLTLVLNETPNTGTDPKRIFVPGVGFAVISTSLAKGGGTALPRYLQKIRTNGDAGVTDCSL